MSKQLPDQHLFILGMNDSGTTFLQNSLSECKNCVSFKHKKNRPNGMEGQGVSQSLNKRNGTFYPRDTDNGVTKLFSEKKGVWQSAKKFNWKKIKPAWQIAWEQNAHWKSANPRILLEKTPSAIYSVNIYLEQFPNAKFIIIHRDPYAICEGIKRTVKKYKRKDYDIKRCAKHWGECSMQQMENIKTLCPTGRAMWLWYEDMVAQPDKIAQQIMHFVPGLEDINFNKKVVCHSMDKPTPRGIQDYNTRHLKNLKPAQFTAINEVLKDYREAMNFFNYPFRNEAP